MGKTALREHWQVDPAASEDALPVRREELAAVVEKQQSRLDPFGLDEELELRTQFESISTYVPREQEEFALWAGVEGNGSIHDGDGTFEQGLTMDIAKGLSIREGTCYAGIAHLDKKVSEEEEGKSSLIDQSLQRQ